MNKLEHMIKLSKGYMYLKNRRIYKQDFFSNPLKYDKTIRWKLWKCKLQSEYDHPE